MGEVSNATTAKCGRILRKKRIILLQQTLSWTTTPAYPHTYKDTWKQRILATGAHEAQKAEQCLSSSRAANLPPLAFFSACAFNAKRKQPCHWQIQTTTTATTVPTGRAAPHPFAWRRLPAAQEESPLLSIVCLPFRKRHLRDLPTRSAVLALHLEQLADVHGAMGRKRLITDSFQVVKKKKRDSKEVKAESPPCDVAETVQVEAILQDAVQPDQEEVLKQFDLSWEFGPCTGITRLQRWERAELLGLKPPSTVRELLLKYKGNPTIIHSLWHEYSL